MIRAVTIVACFVSTIFFPWQFTALLTVFSAAYEPLMPLAIGIFADTLYYAPSVSFVPLFSIAGAVATGACLYIQGRLRTTL